MTKRGKAKKILVLASTFPASDTDPVPAFVKDQVITLKKEYPELELSVLAPHDARSKTTGFTKHEHFDEYRFHYMWPRRFEKLAGRGIMPQLKKNPLYYLVVPFLFAGELLATKRLIAKINPDYIYAHWFTPQGVVAGMAAGRGRIPVVITTHASDVAVWHKVPLGGRVVRHYIDKASAITAVSKRTLEKLQAFFSEKQWSRIETRVRIIPMGVDISSSSPEDTNRTPGQHVAFVGRLAEKKGVQYLLPAFAEIAKKFPKSTLTIAGNGPMLDELKNQAEKLEISDRVTFPGYVSGESKNQVFRTSDIYVVPSIITASGDAEGLPVALMEGLASGKICIATNESGADNILSDGEDGFLVPQKEVHALSKAIATALSLTDKNRQKIQQQAIRTAQQFDWGKIAKEHYEFLFKN